MENIISRFDNPFTPFEYLIKKWYYAYIIQQSSISNYSEKNQRDLVLDTAENLSQISEWTRTCYTQEQLRIELFLGLTRKNINALLTFPLPPGFAAVFSDFCTKYEKLESEYKNGVTNREAWANSVNELSKTLTASTR